jgi:cytosine/uracil/thiamine/allantoin permease
MMTVVALVAVVLMWVGVLMYIWVNPENIKRTTTLKAMLSISALASIACVVLFGIFVSKLISISFDTAMSVLFTALVCVANVKYLKKVYDNIKMRRCLARES